MIKIKSDLLQKMIAKSIQGASNNKILPITSLIGIEYINEQLKLVTTDGASTFVVKEKVSDIGDGQSFYTIVNAEQFSKLVGKTTKEFIELNNNDNYLEVKGNGTYKLDIAINEDGQMIRFKEVKFNDTDDVKVQEINLKDLQEAIKIAKASTAKVNDIQFLTGYYISENTITTDTKLACKLEKQLTTEPFLLSSEMAELLLLVDLDTEDKLILKKLNNMLYFDCKKYCIYGNELDGREDYANNVVKAINNLTALEYVSSATIDKKELLDVLDRMELFVGEYDKNAVCLKFSNTDKTLQIQSLKSNATEEIKLKDTDTINDYECVVNIEMLKSQLQSLNLDTIQLQFGNQRSIQIKEDSTILVIALMDKPN